jgi:hypothetical protein
MEMIKRSVELRMLNLADRSETSIIIYMTRDFTNYRTYDGAKLLLRP